MKNIGITLWKLAAGVALAGLLAPPLAAAQSDLASPPVLIERIVARVNNSIVTQRQYDAQTKALRAQLAQKYSGVALEQEYRKKRQNVLRDMIDEDLLVQKAQDDNISVETQLVRYLDQIRRQQNLNSLEALQKAVEQSGLSWADFKDRIRRQILMRAVIEREVGGRIIIARDDARKFFDTHKNLFQSPAGVHLAEILVSSEKHKPGDAKKLAEQAYQALQNGGRWKDVVSKYSDGPTASEGGDIGFFKQGTLASEVQQKIAKLDTNEYTSPFPTTYGYMIVKVLARQTGSTPTFNEAEPRVMEYLYNEKMQKELRVYLTQLRKESFIRLAPGFVDTGAPEGGEQASLEE
jgi:peptidyl-prolyl cis-trans isomerase SurA